MEHEFYSCSLCSVHAPSEGLIYESIVFAHHSDSLFKLQIRLYFCFVIINESQTSSEKLILIKSSLHFMQHQLFFYNKCALQRSLSCFKYHTLKMLGHIVALCFLFKGNYKLRMAYKYLPFLDPLKVNLEAFNITFYSNRPL